MGASLKIPSALDRLASLVFLGVFASVFVFAGLAAMYGATLHPWLEARAAQNWVETPCRITSVVVKSHNGKNTGLVITYQYQVAGQTLQSQRYDFTPSSASGYAWAAASAHQYRKGNTTVCYVNPQQPTEAVLSRTVENNPLNWVPGIFVLVGLGLLLPVVRGVDRKIKFGESDFELNDAPAPLGGVLEGTVTFGRIIRPTEGFVVKLTCIHRTETGTGKTRNVQETPLWQNAKSVMSDTGGTIPISFALPENGRETSAASQDDRIFWRLDVSAKVPGIHYAAQFEVPVAKAELSAAEVAEARQLRAEETQADAQFQLPAHSRIRVQDSGGGREFYFPALRNLRLVVFFALFTAIWTAVVVVLFRSGAPWDFRLGFAFVEVILLLILVNFCLGSSRVVAENGSIVITRRLLGLGRTRTIPASDIREIKVNIGASMGTQVFYNVQIVRQNGTTQTAATNVPDAHEAHWLALEMAKYAGVGK